jgi:predicted kinase
VAGRGHRDREVAPFGEGIYSDDFSRRTYASLLEQARALVQQGESVVLDASWPTEELRSVARRTALSGGAELNEFECVLSAEECKERIRQRLGRNDRVDFSDATPAIVDNAIASRDPWPAATVLDSGSSVTDLLTEIHSTLEGSHPAHGT